MHHLLLLPLNLLDLLWWLASLSIWSSIGSERYCTGVQIGHFLTPTTTILETQKSWCQANPNPPCFGVLYTLSIWDSSKIWEVSIQGSKFGTLTLPRYSSTSNSRQMAWSEMIFLLAPDFSLYWFIEVLFVIILGIDETGVINLSDMCFVSSSVFCIASDWMLHKNLQLPMILLLAAFPVLINSTLGFWSACGVQEVTIVHIMD